MISAMQERAARMTLAELAGSRTTMRETCPGEQSKRAGWKDSLQ
jgi:hypothetical protein